MKFFGAVLLLGAFLSIIMEGTYSKREVVEVTLHLVPTHLAQPDLIERSLIGFDGIQSAVLERATSTIAVTYDKSRITLSELEHLLTSMGYRPVPIEPIQAAL